MIDARRIRRNFLSREAAEAWRHESEQNRLIGPSVENLRSTWLSDDQLRIAEGLFHRATGDELVDAFEWWERHGKSQAATSATGAGMSVEEAFQQFRTWLKLSTLRQRTRTNLADRIGRFVSGIGHIHLSDLGPDVVELWLGKRDVSAVTKDNDRRAISRFFRWCIERPRRWIASNPCGAVHVPQPKRGTPPTLQPRQCLALLRAGEAYRSGRQVRHLALCLFGGLRPDEAVRLREEDINLEDGEVRIRAEVSKTHTARMVTTTDSPLGDWLRAFPDSPLSMSSTTRRRDMLAIRRAAGIAHWPHDVLRHTAASALIRLCGSYALVADRLGNSESILRKHYVAGWPTGLANEWAGIRPSMRKNRSHSFNARVDQ